MGFIERLKQEKLQKETQAKRQQRNQQGGERQPIRNVESAKNREEKSERYYEESGCSLLVNKLSTIIDGSIGVYERNWEGGHKTRTEEIIGNFRFNLLRNDQERLQMFTDRVFGYIKYKENGFGSHVVFLTWVGNERRGNGSLSCMAVETCPGGEMYFHGGLFGSSVIRKDQWQKDKDCLENALEKEYHNPKKYRGRPYHSSGYGHNDGPGMGT